MAAISGFLSVAAACGGKGTAPNSTEPPSGSNAVDADYSADVYQSAAGASFADSGAAVTISPDTPPNPHTPIPATMCAFGQVPHPAVTSAAVGAITQDEFASLCAAKNGIFEIQPLCGGSNSCRGMSYDSGSETLTEHSCQATNTCAGYSCVVCG